MFLGFFLPVSSTSSSHPTADVILSFLSRHLFQTLVIHSIFPSISRRFTDPPFLPQDLSSQDYPAVTFRLLNTTRYNPQKPCELAGQAMRRLSGACINGRAVKNQGRWKKSLCNPTLGIAEALVSTRAFPESRLSSTSRFESGLS